MSGAILGEMLTRADGVHAMHITEMLKRAGDAGVRLTTPILSAIARERGHTAKPTGVE
jgi:hypothetical protein